MKRRRNNKSIMFGMCEGNCSTWIIFSYYNSRAAFPLAIFVKKNNKRSKRRKLERKKKCFQWRTSLQKKTQTVERPQKDL